MEPKPAAVAGPDAAPALHSRRSCTATMRLLPAALLFWSVQSGKAVAETAVGPQQVTALINAAEPNVADAAGWARDILDNLGKLGLPHDVENVCAVIAIVDQESGFVANPAITDLRRIQQAVRDMIAEDRKLRLFFSMYPEIERELFERIRSSKTERDIDLTYRWLVDSMLSRFRGELLIRISGTLVDFIESKNPISTIGSMQVSVNSALEAERNYREVASLTLDDVYLVRDFLYTRPGGLYNGIRQLLDYRTGYTRKIHRFADYNAGRYSSRNAAFQKVVADLSGVTLVLDGDLLIYDGGSTPSREVSNTERGARIIAERFGLPLSDVQIRTDLLGEKGYEFIETETFNVIRNLYQHKHGIEAPFAIIPDIALDSVKITRIFTTEKFARQVGRRYQNCVRRAQ